VPGLFNSARAKRYMKDSGLEALVASSALNVRYFTGYACWLDPLFREYMINPGGSGELSHRSYALCPLEGEMALVVKSLMSVEAADLGIKDIRLYGDAGVEYSMLSSPVTNAEMRFLALLRGTPPDTTAIGALASALRDRGLADGKLGFEMEGLSSSVVDEIRRSLPRAELKDCSNLLRLVRAVKTPGEIALLVRAAEIAENSAREALGQAKVGGRANELVREFQTRVGAQGAAYDHFSFSLRGLGICSEPHYVFRSDDVLFIDYGCIVASYFSDTGTTLAFSDLSPELARRHTALHSAVAEGAKAMRPGTRSSSVQRVMANVVKENGITNSFPHGHGMGIEIRDYPVLVPPNNGEIRDECIAVNSDLLLEEGMVINLEAPLFMPTAGALQVEKTFLVTANGARELIVQDRSRPYSSA
jgi:Xaa-Pro dipeptidase